MTDVLERDRERELGEMERHQRAQAPYEIAEQSVLGSMLLNDDAVDTAIAALGPSPDPFAVAAHAHVYEAMVTLHQQRRPIDSVTLVRQLEAMGTLADAGGAGYIASLTDVVPTSYNAAHYAEVVLEHHMQRELRRLAASIMAAIDRGKCDKEVLAGYQRDITATYEQHDRGKARHIKDVMPDVQADIDRKRAAKTTLTGVATGMPRLDEVMLGLRPGTLNILGARPSVGKSAMAANIAYNAAQAGHPVLFFSLEMYAPQVARRMVSIDQGVPFKTLCSDFQVEIQNTRFAKACTALGGSTIYIDDSSSLTLWQLRSRIRRFARQHIDKPTPLAIIDYLQLLSGDKRLKRHEQLGEITRELKVLAGELECPILLLSQVGREGAGGDDIFRAMSNLKESGAIEQDADTIMMALDVLKKHNTESAEKLGLPVEHVVNFGLAKNRDGDVGYVPLYFNKPTQKIVTLKDYADSQTHQYEMAGMGAPAPRTDDYPEDYYTENPDDDEVF